MNFQETKDLVEKLSKQYGIDVTVEPLAENEIEEELKMSPTLYRLTTIVRKARSVSKKVKQEVANEISNLNPRETLDIIKKENNENPNVALREQIIANTRDFRASFCGLLVEAFDLSDHEVQQRVAKEGWNIFVAAYDEEVNGITYDFSTKN